MVQLADCRVYSYNGCIAELVFVISSDLGVLFAGYEDLWRASVPARVHLIYKNVFLVNFIDGDLLLGANF